MDSSILNSLGLVLDMIGAILIATFGIPPKVDRKGEGSILLEQTDSDEIRKAKKYDFISGLGFALLIFGFFLQIVSNFM